MNKKLFFRAAALAIAATLAGCSGGIMPDGTTESQEGTQGITEFAVARDNAKTSGAPWTRTSGEYTGSSVKFYWTSGDKLWINDGSVLKASKRSNIPAANGKELTAKFWFDGNYTASNYPVRYTGNSNTQGGKVTIKAAQAQQAPNDGSHIGDDGDCGTATATRGSDGKYRFMLDHKASYLTFMPYYSKIFDSSVKVTQIKVSADQSVAGTYDFDDTGIKLATAASTSQGITLELNGGGTNGFEIPAAVNYAKNAAIMVIAPGSYTNFTVEYTLYDKITHVTGTVKKNYGNVTCNVGKNKKIAADLDITNYSDRKYYMWDAQQEYWYGVSDYPTVTGQSNSNYAQNSSDPRWHNTTTTTQATQSCQTAPNANEIIHYVMNGDPHWDNTTLWSTNGHLYRNGVWFKKKSKITNFSGISYEGVDYRTQTNIPIMTNNNVAPGKPSNTEDYFYLPALGHNFKGTISVNHGYYWSSSPTKAPNLAFSAYLYSNSVSVRAVSRPYGFQNWTWE